MSENRYLRDELTEYAKSRAYPFHMPGHKRQPVMTNPYELDITEISGFDNLHHARGILHREQVRAARLYGADTSFYLVNGSTCGILAAISAAVPRGGHVLAARNCHKSVYHALQLREAAVTYVYPVITHVGICGQIRACDVEDIVQQNCSRVHFMYDTPVTDRDKECILQDTRKMRQDGTDAGQEQPFCAIVLTSPTYDGVVSDIKSIAQLAHQYGIPLIVDAAHGAHFGFVPDFPGNPIALGADACIVSVHKTLPAFTQTALLHLQGKRISAERVAEFLDIYETSSPSYLLMAGISESMRFMEENGTESLMALSGRLEVFYEKMSALRHLHVLRKEELSAEEAFDFDPSKILILTGQSGTSGVELAQQLRVQYGLEPEMACEDYVLALTTMMDTEEGFRRLEEALLRIDGKLGKNSVEQPEVQSEEKPHGTDAQIAEPEQVLSITDAAERDWEEVPLTEAFGKVSCSMAVPYPPGIPAIVPGERIDGQMIAEINRCLEYGIEVEGLTENHRIKIVKF